MTILKVKRGENKIIPGILTCQRLHLRDYEMEPFPKDYINPLVLKV